MTTTPSTKNTDKISQTDLFSRSFMYKVVQSMSLPLIITDHRQRCLFLNQAAELLIGYNNDEIHARHLSTILELSYLSDAQQFFVADLMEIALQPTQALCPVVLRRKDGHRLSIMLNAAPICEDGQIVGIRLELHQASQAVAPPAIAPPQIKQALERQVPPEKRSAAMLQFSHSQLMSLFEESPAAVAILRGPNHIYDMVNECYYKILGRRDLLGRPVREAVPELIDQGVIDPLDEVYRTGKRFVAQRVSVHIQRRPDAPLEESIVNFAYQPLFEANGSVYGILVHVVDMTAEIRAQELRSAVERRYRYLLTAVPQSIFLADPQGLVLEVNAITEEILGRSSQDIVGRYIHDFIAPEDFFQTYEALSGLYAGFADSLELEFLIVRPSGERRLVQFSVTRIVVNGQISGLQGTARDVTDERARDEQMHLLNLVLERIEQGVALMDNNLCFRFANPAAKALLGIPADCKETLTVEHFLPDEAARQELTEIMATMQEVGLWSGRIRRRRLSDGQVMLFDVMKGRAIGVDGEPLFFTIFQDASEVIRREQQLRRAERLASLGTLISGVAHELNNPLTTIIGSCELLLMEQRSQQESDDLKIICHEAKRMARIVSDLRLSARYTQEQNHPKGPVNLNAVVEHVLKLQAYRLQTGNISVETVLADNLPAVYGDASQLEQVLLNLVINAEHAMQIPRKQHRLLVCTLWGEDGVVLEVHDTGVGIEPSHLDRLFDPFFTTKAPGDGTGLGLSLVHSIVQEHGGVIHVDSQVGIGTTFRIQFQIAYEAQESPANNYELLASPPQNILLIDDEPPIREVLARFLRGRGHRVATANDGHQALSLVAHHNYDCIISDLRMPGIDGERLLNYLQQRGIKSRLMLLTGDSTSSASARLQANEGIEVLFKPISPLDIARVIEQPLGRERTNEGSC